MRSLLHEMTSSRSQLSQGLKFFKFTLKRHHVATLPLQQEHFPVVSCPQMFCGVALDTLELNIDH